MNLFDHVREWPNADGLDVIVELKYGKPIATSEYVESLPPTVVQIVLDKLGHRGPRDLPAAQDLLHSLLCFSSKGNSVESSISEALLQYHSLLGHV